MHINNNKLFYHDSRLYYALSVTDMTWNHDQARAVQKHIKHFRPENASRYKAEQLDARRYTVGFCGWKMSKVGLWELGDDRFNSEKPWLHTWLWSKVHTFF